MMTLSIAGSVARAESSESHWIGLRPGTYLESSNVSFAIGIDLPVQMPALRLPGGQVLSADIIAGGQAGKGLALSLVQRFPVRADQQNASGPYFGLGVGLVAGTGSGLAAKGVVGINVNRRLYAEADYFAMSKGAVMLGVGTRF